MTAVERKQWETKKLQLYERITDLGFSSAVLYDRPYNAILESEDLRWFLWLAEVGNWLQSFEFIKIYASMDAFHLYTVITNTLDNLHDGQKTILRERGNPGN